MTVFAIQFIRSVYYLNYHSNSTISIILHYLINLLDNLLFKIKIRYAGQLYPTRFLIFLLPPLTPLFWILEDHHSEWVHIGLMLPS